MAFYKLETDKILCGENFVFSPDFTLLAEEKDNYQYPYHNWYWFDNFKDALLFFSKNYDNEINSQK